MRTGKALIAGGAGFIGSHLCDRLVDEGFHVICVDNLSTGRRSNIQHLMQSPCFEFVEHDITEPLSQIDCTAITAMQYNMFATARWFSSYETIGGLFREVTRNSVELTITERIWGMIVDIANEIAQCFEIEDEKIFETLIMRSDKLMHFIRIYELKMAS